MPGSHHFPPPSFRSRGLPPPTYRQSLIEVWIHENGSLTPDADSWVSIIFQGTAEFFGTAELSAGRRCFGRWWIFSEEKCFFSESAEFFRVGGGKATSLIAYLRHAFCGCEGALTHSWQRLRRYQQCANHNHASSRRYSKHSLEAQIRGWERVVIGCYK